jgi:ankyrin repeat protein
MIPRNEVEQVKPSLVREMLQSVASKKKPALDTIEKLIDQGAPFEEKGASALVWAAAQGYADICSLMLDRGADVNSTDELMWGSTGLTVASSNENSTALVKLFLDHGAAVDARTEQGMTGLIWAAARGQADAASLLLDHGANINAQNDDGKTALIWAAFAGHKEVAELLVKKGANLGIRDEDGMTALDRARKYSPRSGIAAIIEKELGLEPFTPKGRKSGPKP